MVPALSLHRRCGGRAVRRTDATSWLEEWQWWTGGAREKGEIKPGRFLSLDSKSNSQNRPAPDRASVVLTGFSTLRRWHSCKLIYDSSSRKKLILSLRAATATRIQYPAPYVGATAGQPESHCCLSLAVNTAFTARRADVFPAPRPFALFHVDAHSPAHGWDRQTR